MSYHARTQYYASNSRSSNPNWDSNFLVNGEKNMVCKFDNKLHNGIILNENITRDLVQWPITADQNLTSL